MPQRIAEDQPLEVCMLHDDVIEHFVITSKLINFDAD